MPTQFHGQLNEWAGEVKAYLAKHNVHTEHYMEASGRSEDEQEDYDEYNDTTLTIRRKRDEITIFSQTLNYVLVHSTKPASEARPMINDQKNHETIQWFEVW
eukprot:1534529-Amphidinium_carterae.1